MSTLLHKTYVVTLSTIGDLGGGVKNPQNTVNVVYGCHQTRNFTQNHIVLQISKTADFLLYRKEILNERSSQINDISQ